MGKKILIYDNGQRYEIDSDLIYNPWALVGTRRGVKTQPQAMELKAALDWLKDDYEKENKNDTESKEEKGKVLSG